MLIELDSNVNASQTLIDPDSNNSVSDTLGRKRKGRSDSSDDGNKENVSPDKAPPYKRTRRSSVLADQPEGFPTDTLSLLPRGASLLDELHSSEQSESDPMDTLSLPPRSTTSLLNELHSDQSWNSNVASSPGTTFSNIVSVSESLLEGFSDSGILLPSSA
jgi:hypothetical protein